MDKVKTELALFSFFAIFLAALPFIALYVYDPLQVFHKHWYSDERVHGNMRQQAAGLINNYEFDSVILGTSMMKGSSALLASELFGGQFVNLSADGSTWFERSIILDYALRKKSLKTVIFSLDTGLDIHSQTTIKKYPLDNFRPLYDKNPLNDISIYWNNFHLKCLWKLSKSAKCIGHRRGLQRDRGWFENVSKRNASISGIDGWLSEEGRGRAVRSRLRRHVGNKDGETAINKREASWRSIVDRDILPLVREHPRVNFKFIFPPYSRFMTSVWQQENPNKYNDYKKVIAYWVAESSLLSNLEVYGFDNLAYTDDITNYRDMRHYNVDINEEMFRRMSAGSNVIKQKNVDAYLSEFDHLNAIYSHQGQLERVLRAYPR